ncbi:hypothetical protein [Micromonospora sp. NBC_01796]|uniref:hypothetical protein n=1 Tax=Micromonospora sp. NBC_01796 TaxID=2975987 RepID=UPI002DD80AFB|nr:hypothetical protein [Micromonospora sp. NBC_01796]WSA88720.1 hypothetical protein OIE47_14565 [Micromonospora sp. NBC_01796]
MIFEVAFSIATWVNAYAPPLITTSSEPVATSTFVQIGARRRPDRRLLLPDPEPLPTSVAPGESTPTDNSEPTDNPSSTADPESTVEFTTDPELSGCSDCGSRACCFDCPDRFDCPGRFDRFDCCLPPMPESLPLPLRARIVTVRISCRVALP